MASRKLDRFPTAFERLTRRALTAMAGTSAEGPPLLSIPCPTRGAAVNLQMQIRQYWIALEEAHRSGASGLYAGIEDIAHRASVLAVRYNKADKRVLEVIHRNQMRGASILASALGELDQSLDAMDGADPTGKRQAPVAPVASGADAAIEAAFPEAFPAPK